MRNLFSKRQKHIFIVKKSVVASVLVIAAAAGLFGAVSIPTIAQTAAATRQLPIYSVECEGKRCSLSFDAAWGNVRVRRLCRNGLRAFSTLNSPIGTHFHP